MRHYFEIVTDTGVPASVVKGDTGIINGRVLQVHVKPTVADTGGDLEIGIYPTSDTGDGWLFYNNNDVLGAESTFVPQQSISTNLDGTTDTGFAPVVGEGDRLRVKVRAGRVVAAGGVNTTRIWVWTSNDNK